MIQSQSFTVLGKSTFVSGIFNFEGPAHIHGKLEGTINANTSEKVVLEIGSSTNANIHCGELEIYGEFNGEIKSSGLVILYPTAIVTGKIIAKSIEIFPGATVNINGHTDELTKTV